MKLTKESLTQMIKEAMIKIVEKEKEEESPKEDLGPDAYACEAEQTKVILDDLKKILEKWEEAEYESDEARWQEYAKDVQGLIDQYEGEEAPEKHTEGDGRCDDGHSDQSHEEWEASQKEEGEKEEKSEKPKEKKEKGKDPTAHVGSKARSPTASKEAAATKPGKNPGKSFPYESKQLEQAVFQKLITALGD